jgi:hypothetical protein
MRIIGKGSWEFGELEFRQVLSWLFAAVLTVVMSQGVEILGVLQSADGWRNAISAVAVIVIRGVYVMWADNRNKMETDYGV